MMKEEEGELRTGFPPMNMEKSHLFLGKKIMKRKKRRKRLFLFRGRTLSCLPDTLLHLATLALLHRAHLGLQTRALLEM
jgi:hypothetical protein